MSISEPWFDGQVVVKGESQSLRYRHYNQPILLDDFRMQDETTDVSPLHTVLSHRSRSRRDGGITEEEGLSYYADPQYVLDDIKKYELSYFNKE